MKPCRLIPLLGLAILAIVPGGAAWAQKNTRTSVIESMLPPNTVAYAHFRTQDIYKSEQFAFARKILEHAGADAVKHFDRRFGNLFSKMETITAIFPNERCEPMLPSGRPDQRTVVWIITTKEPIDRAEMMKTVLSRSTVKKHGEYSYHFDERTWSGTMFLDPQTVAYAAEDSLWALLDLKAASKEKGVLANCLAEDAGNSACHVGIDPSTFQKLPVFGVPAEYEPLFTAKTWSVAMTLGSGTRVTARMVFPDAEQAKAGAKSVQFGISSLQEKLGEVLKKTENDQKKAPSRLPTDFFEPTADLLGIGVLKFAKETLRSLPVQAKGTIVECSVDLDTKLPHVATGIQSFFMLALPTALSSKYVGESKWMVEDRVRRHEQIVDALERYHNDKGHYPAPYTKDGNGKALLSWRVAILPYLGQENKGLYEQFKLDEPWDSPANRKLLSRMPYVFEHSWRDHPRTGFQYVTGPQTLFPENKGFSKNDINDRKEYAVLVVNVENPDSLVLWTKPGDVEYDPKKAVPDLIANTGFKGLLIYTLDGNFRHLPESFLDDGYRALFEHKSAKEIKGVSWPGIIQPSMNQKRFEDKFFDEKKTLDHVQPMIDRVPPRLEPAER